ncbi:MAG: hypothetical protein M3Y65_19530 [Pseudomonadota bacterium]|nr:hypothetical protein [Pseudomonadota bacterium]
MRIVCTSHRRRNAIATSNDRNRRIQRDFDQASHAKSMHLDQLSSAKPTTARLAAAGKSKDTSTNRSQ